ncbi:precorrin-6A/cobalt-precorrin-6A reductase [Aquimarina sp. 2201CG5-10]|uniref:precorrin-6A/cobalt-precorrin-6A reductase n=1 Tax=Aquimarina callyspongiae TaxID=3098150 RepID=UPI002AB4C8A9|nr:precorrin-6A/cobalt-precorrin-6A reductase [Aquimarina sp. 2201CG5-10]MDY8136629.1 precorrin-6A/cobalt-precorrin-6A reductase [Aquimarina sp. 2201CG5-10]
MASYFQEKGKDKSIVMILVFGGTTEGKLVAKTLDEYDIKYYYSTKTQVKYNGKGTPIFGEMTFELLEAFCKEKSITHIINASHPFASQLHQTVANTSLELPIVRFQRKFSPRSVHKLVHYVDNFEEALNHFKKGSYRTLLGLSGVQTISKLKPFWRDHQAWFRILDRDSSRAIAAKSNFPETHLLFGYPQSKKEEMLLFAKINPEVIFTKESGSNGKLEEKIEASLALNIPIVILKKPKISNRYLCIDTSEELIKVLT